MTENQHQEEALDEYLERLAARTYNTYRIFSVLVLLFTIYQFGWWWGLGCYIATLFLFPVVMGIVGVISGALMTSDKLQRLTREYHIRQVNGLIDELGIDRSELEAMADSYDTPQAPPIEATITPSESIIGRFMDTPIHEWLDVTINGTPFRYEFDAPAQKISGEYQLAEGECVLYNGLIYKVAPCTSQIPSTVTPT